MIRVAPTSLSVRPLPQHVRQGLGPDPAGSPLELILMGCEWQPNVFFRSSSDIGTSLRSRYFLMQAIMQPENRASIRWTYVGATHDFFSKQA
jgi:hypothetical protein